MIRGPIRHQPVPGDISRGRDRPYKGAHLQVTTPTLPIRSMSNKFLNALPATFVPMLVGGQGGAPEGVRPNRYLGLAPLRLQPVIEKKDPWE